MFSVLYLLLNDTLLILCLCVLQMQLYKKAKAKGYGEDDVVAVYRAALL